MQDYREGLFNQFFGCKYSNQRVVRDVEYELQGSWYQVRKSQGFIFVWTFFEFSPSLYQCHLLLSIRLSILQNLHFTPIIHRMFFNLTQYEKVLVPPTSSYYVFLLDNYQEIQLQIYIIFQMVRVFYCDVQHLQMNFYGFVVQQIETVSFRCGWDLVIIQVITLENFAWTSQRFGLEFEQISRHYYLKVGQRLFCLLKESYFRV
eukprot:TRINITY_DN7471_c0_g3_i2.p2 TRINITY_DN7471_c0_g3~~TRINITY_DN7471_c0_g3_i2.p2  ORF type:complete len:204 (-),score=-15.10 TRINITY_DN7471_c0_g3_i2:281-892(-)